MPRSDPEGVRYSRSLLRYPAALVLVAIATLLGMVVRGRIEPANLVMLYLTAVLLAAVNLGRGPSVLASFAGVLAFDYFLVPPFQTLNVHDTEYLLTFLALLVVSLVVSELVARARTQAEAASRREEQTAALYELGRELTAATELAGVARTIITQIEKSFKREVVIYLPEAGRLKATATTAGFEPAQEELAVATWAFEHAQPAGRGTDTLPDAPLRCVPLQTARGMVGVIGVRPSDSSRFLNRDQRRALNAFANQAALAIERILLAEQAQHAELLVATDRLQTALLNTISHDLRTPLVTITGALSALDEPDAPLDDAARRGLITGAREQADRLNRLVANLLNMTRLEAGALRLTLQPGDIQDAIGSALGALGSRLENRQVITHVPDDLPLVPMDFVLIVQVLVNLLDNALKYAPIDQPVEVSASAGGERLFVTVADRGPGIPDAELERVFDKFHRVKRPAVVGGTGLGLSICRGIVEAHAGGLEVSNREGGGLEVTFWLPARRGDR